MGRKCIERVEAQQWTAQANRNEAVRAAKRNKDLPLGDALDDLPRIDFLSFDEYIKHTAAVDALQDMGHTYDDAHERWDQPRMIIQPPAPEKEKPGFTFYLFVLLASAAGAYLTIKYAVP